MIRNGWCMYRSTPAFSPGSGARRARARFAIWWSRSITCWPPARTLVRFAGTLRTSSCAARSWEAVIRWRRAPQGRPWGAELMHFLDFTPGHGTPITVYNSHGAFAVPLGEGRGEGHVYCVRIEPGGSIGAHEAGFGQLFLVVGGSGWVSGPDGEQRPLGVG